MPAQACTGENCLGRAKPPETCEGIDCAPLPEGRQFHGRGLQRHRNADPKIEIVEPETGAIAIGERSDDVQLVERPAFRHPFIAEGRAIDGAIAAMDDQLAWPGPRRSLLQPMT